MASPRILSVCKPVADCLERRDAAGLVAVLSPLADDPDLDNIGATIAAVFPHLRARPVPAVWPSDREAQCMALLAAGMARPCDDTVLLRQALPPTTWNWLTSLGDVLSGRTAAPVAALKIALDALDVTQAAALLQACPAPASRRGWQALLMTAALKGPETDQSVERALDSVLQDITRDIAPVPPPVVAVVLAQLARRRTVPDKTLHATAAALPLGLSRDLATAAALTAWSEAGLLAADAVDRITTVPGDHTVLLRAGPNGHVWLALLRQLLRTTPTGSATLLACDPSLGTGYDSIVRDVETLAKSAAATNMAVTARMAVLLLRRLRRDDLAAHVTRAPPVETDHLAAIMVPSGVLNAIETPRPVAERAARLVGEADATTIGRPVGTTAVRAVTSADVSICIVNHNQAMTTARLLTSLARTWRDFDGEVLLFDNGSEAQDLEHLSSCAASFWPGRVRLIRSEDNRGPGSARNLLFAEVRTPWILSLDNDMIAIADIGAHLLPAVAASDASMFNLAYEELDHPGVAGVGKTWSIIENQVGDKVFKTGFASWIPTNSAAVPTLVRSNRLSGGASLIETATFKRLGGFAADNAIGYEDYEFSLRLADHDISIETLSTPLLVHGHLAPARATDLQAVASRFDRARMERSTQAFAAVVSQRFGAHLGEREAARPPHRIVPRRLDLRHAHGHRFFAAVRPGARTIGLLVDDTIASGVTPLLDWLDARDVNVEVRHAREFVEPEQALLVLQACDMIIAGSALQCLSIDRCRNLGLVWSAVDPRPVMIVPPENAAWVQAIASFL